jgi:site-specific recombinase XerD
MGIGDTRCAAGGELLRVQARDGSWSLAGAGAAGFRLINEYLGYLADRRYSPRTVRSYAFDLLAFARWLLDEGVGLETVDAEVLLRFLAFCRRAPVAGRPGGNVVSMRAGGSTGYAPATINRRLVAIAGLFDFRAMRDPARPNPVPRGMAARRTARGERHGLLGHLARPGSRSRLRVREPRRLPRGLEPAEVGALFASLHSHRDRAIAGLMLYCGLRSAEVLGLAVGDVDVGGGWVRVVGKGERERRVPLDGELAGLIQTYLLVERPVTGERALFVVAKGPSRGRPLTAAGLRTIFRYHRAKAGVEAAHPHALRHSFGSALAAAGVDLAVIQALLGHEHVDSAVRYIHLAPAHVRASYDAARLRERAGR